MLNIYLNRVAIWKPVAKDELDKRLSPSGQAYLTKDSMVFKQSDGPLTRYVKNYTAGKGKSAVKFSLFLRTDRTDDESVEAEMDDVAKEITAEYAKSAIEGSSFTQFTYTDFYIKDKEVQ